MIEAIQPIKDFADLPVLMQNPNWDRIGSTVLHYLKALDFLHGENSLDIALPSTQNGDFRRKVAQLTSEVVFPATSEYCIPFRIDPNTKAGKLASQIRSFAYADVAAAFLSGSVIAVPKISDSARPANTPALHKAWEESFPFLPESDDPQAESRLERFLMNTDLFVATSMLRALGLLPQKMTAIRQLSLTPEYPDGLSVDPLSLHETVHAKPIAMHEHEVDYLLEYELAPDSIYDNHAHFTYPIGNLASLRELWKATGASSKMYNMVVLPDIDPKFGAASDKLLKGLSKAIMPNTLLIATVTSGLSQDDLIARQDSLKQLFFYLRRNGADPRTVDLYHGATHRELLPMGISSTKGATVGALVCHIGPKHIQ